MGNKYSIENKLKEEFIEDSEKNKIDLCKQYEDCVSSCNNYHDKKQQCIEDKKCKIKYNCDIEKDIDKLIKIIEKINNKSIILSDIKQIGEIIKNNLTPEDKTIIKNNYIENKLDCKDTNKPCLINRKLLLQYMLSILIYKIEIIYELKLENINKNTNITNNKKKELIDILSDEKNNVLNKYNKYKEEIGIPTNEDTYKYLKKL